jgi:membrane protease YdiL (CAAX protease family)
VFLAVAALSFWSLLTGDARTVAEFADATAPGLTPVGVIASLVTAAVCAFIFASAAASRAKTLRSIADVRRPLRWWLVAMFLPAALLLVSLAVAFATNDEIPPVDILPWFNPRAIRFTLLVVGIGEETGWRGWMLPELQKRYSPLRSSVLVGVMWGLWHFPMFVVGLYPGLPDAVVEYLFIGPLVAILMTWLYNRTGGSLLLAILLHTAINNSQRLLPTTMLFPVLLTAFLVAVVVIDRMWRRVEADGSIQ